MGVMNLSDLLTGTTNLSTLEKLMFLILNMLFEITVKTCTNTN